MNKILLTVALGIFVVSCTKTECTTEDRSKWLDENEFRQGLTDRGYKIQEFKVTDGNCYEIYGWDQEQRKVEIYFNPVDGSKVKEEIH